MVWEVGEEGEEFFKSGEATILAHKSSDVHQLTQ